jgi:hypothetical protein
MGEKANSPHAKIDSVKIHIEILPFVEINEYDGEEYVSINYEQANSLLCDEFASSYQARGKEKND